MARKEKRETLKRATCSEPSGRLALEHGVKLRYRTHCQRRSRLMGRSRQLHTADRAQRLESSAESPLEKNTRARKYPAQLPKAPGLSKLRRKSKNLLKMRVEAVQSCQQSFHLHAL